MHRTISNNFTTHTRYLFQAQEMDNEIKGDGNSVNYKYRMHDPRLGRFFAVDPLAAKYPHNSPYAFSENDVIAHVELEGLEKAELPFKGGKPNPKAGKADFSAHEEKTPMLQGGPGLKETPNALLMPTKKHESKPINNEISVEKSSGLTTETGLQSVDFSREVSLGGLKLTTNHTIELKESKNGITLTTDKKGDITKTLESKSGTINLSKDEATYGNSFFALGGTTKSEFVMSISVGSYSTSVYLDTKRWTDLGNKIIKSMNETSKIVYPVVIPLIRFAL